MIKFNLFFLVRQQLNAIKLREFFDYETIFHQQYPLIDANSTFSLKNLEYTHSKKERIYCILLKKQTKNNFEYF